MGTEPIGRLLAAMSWPAILSMMILALYNIVDSIFVARISTQALTAVSLVNPVQMLMVAVSVGSAVGVNSLIARRLGARRFREANQAASTSLRIGFWNFVLWAVFGAVFARPFMQMYTSDAQVLEYGVQYLRIVTTLSVFTMIDVQIEKVLQATGNMVAPMIISISGALTNVALDPILIFGLFGLPRLEVVGAAYATIIGQAVSLTVALFIFFRNKQEVTIQIRGYKRDWKVVRDIYAVGLPGMVMQSIGSIMLFGYNAIIAASATAVAVLGVYFKLQMFVFMPVFGMNQGAMPIMGYNYGARNK
ncbi:MAG: MATE family efflux transporter, partial [Eubacterium sp.]|nr:MATE family efflux transporter [Eubacterium sp.]